MMKTINYIIYLLVIGFLTSQTTLVKEEINLKNGPIQLPGTLTKTNSSKQLIIWVHGSGNVDRNGNQKGANVNSNYIQQFREAVNKENIAFFSYDKRTANAFNMQHLKNTRFEDFANDVKIVVEHFKKENKFDEIILAGHSQGSLTAMLAMGKADKFISIAGPGESIDETIIKQVSNQNPMLGGIAKQHFKELKNTDTIKEVNVFLKSIFNPINQKFIASWMYYNPAIEIKKINKPILIVNGDKDLQVKVEDAKILKENNKSAKLAIIKNMNHVLKHIEKDADNMNSYYSPDFPISKELIKEVVEFVKK